MVEVKDSPADRSSQKSARANVTISVQPAAVVADNSQVTPRYYIGLRFTGPLGTIYPTLYTGTRLSLSIHAVTISSVKFWLKKP